MRFEVYNDFSERDTMEKSRNRVTPFDYDKFRNGRTVELNTEEEVLEFLKEAKETIKFVEDHKWDFITVGIYPYFGRKSLGIYIAHEFRD